MKPRFLCRTARLARSFGLIVSLGFILGSCSKKDAEPSPPAASASAVAPAAGAFDASPGPLAPGETVAGRLAEEAQHRPPIKPNADDIFAAFEHAGAPVPRKQQSLGRTYKSPFCEGGYTFDVRLAINICEYPDDAAAAAGLAASKAAFPGLTTRKVWNHKLTTVTIIEQKQGDSAIPPLEKKLSDVYMAL
jgi:hypothetical protein